MIGVIVVLVMLIIVQFVVIHEINREHGKQARDSQIRFLEHLNQRQDDIRGLTEAFLRSEGKQVILRPAQRRELGASWLDTKPPEAFIKSPNTGDE